MWGVGWGGGGVKPVLRVPNLALMVVLSSIVITVLEKGSAGRCAGCLLVCPRFMVSCITTLSLDAGGGLWSLIVTLPGDLSIVFSLYIQHNITYFGHIDIFNKFAEFVSHASHYVKLDKLWYTIKVSFDSSINFVAYFPKENHSFVFASFNCHSFMFY